MKSNFGIIDASIVIGYALILVAVGVYFTRKQKRLDEFFLAGQKLGSFMVGLSLLCALHSGIAYIRDPSATIKYGLCFTVTALSWIFLYPWAAWVTIPFYRKLNMYTAYEYLERRFGLSVRILAGVVFLLWRLGWMATSIYVPCLTVKAVTGGQVQPWFIALILGILVTTYTSLGGIKAVIWTDAIQYVIMLAGVAAAIAVVVVHVHGGIGTIWSTAVANGKTVFPIVPHSAAQFFTDPTMTVGILIAIVVGRMTSYVGDQIMVQRFQTTKSIQASRQAFTINAISDVIWAAGLAFVGLALFAYYKVHALPPGTKNDEIFPTFITQLFPTGTVGLVVAAIVGASLAATGSAINACTSVIMIDFYNRLFLGRQVERDDPSLKNDSSQVRVARIVSVLVGLAGILLSTSLGRLGDLIEINNKVIQTPTGPLLAIFMLGMFSRRARTAGVFVGGIVGTGMAIYIAFWTKIAFFWPTVFGFATTIVSGYVISLLTPGTVPTESRALTWYDVVHKTDREPAGAGIS